MLLLFANAKGGSGKTTLSLATAGEAEARGLRCPVIDLDVQGNATEHLIGTDDPLRPAGNAGRAIYRTIMDGDPLQVVAVRPLLDLVPAGLRTQSLADELNRVAGNRTEVIASSFSGLRHATHAATARYVSSTAW